MRCGAVSVVGQLSAWEKTNPILYDGRVKKEVWTV